MEPNTLSNWWVTNLVHCWSKGQRSNPSRLDEITICLDSPAPSRRWLMNLRLRCLNYNVDREHSIWFLHDVSLPPLCQSLLVLVVSHLLFGFCACYYSLCSNNPSLDLRKPAPKFILCCWYLNRMPRDIPKIYVVSAWIWTNLLKIQVANLWILNKLTYLSVVNLFVQCVW